MSIADHFDHAPDANFVRDYDSSTARRQFNMSLMLIAVVALAAAALGAVVRFDAPAAQVSAYGPMASAPPAYVGKL